MISLSGDIETIDLPDVLMMISQSEKTGVFSIRRGMEEKKLYFRKGMLVFASSTNDNEKLGEIMFETGLITKEKLLEARRRQAETDDRIGNILLMSGDITQDNLISALKAQASKIIMNLLSWWGGYFTFEEGDFPTSNKLVVGFDLKAIIMDAAASADEWLKVKSKITSTDIIPRFSDELPKGLDTVSINRVEWGVFSLIDGKRTVKEICSLSPYDDMETCKLLTNLLERGLIILPMKRGAEVGWENQLEKAQIEPIVDFYNEVFRLIHRRAFDIDKKNARIIVEKVLTDVKSANPYVFDDLSLKDDGSFDKDIALQNILRIMRSRRVEVVQNAFNNLINNTLIKFKEYYGQKKVDNIKKELQNLIDFLMHKEISILSKLGLKEGLNLLIESI
ncbi:MAG: DUF4388 domain-containing protein [bacterium]